MSSLNSFGFSNFTSSSICKQISDSNGQFSSLFVEIKKMSPNLRKNTISKYFDIFVTWYEKICSAEFPNVDSNRAAILKSVHFKKPVMRSSFLEKMCCHFQYNNNKYENTFWKKWRSPNWLLNERILGGLTFFKIQLFLLIKIPRERNWVQKK